MVQKFNLQAPYTPQGDQPSAIAKLLEGLEERRKASNVTWCNGDGENIHSFECREGNQ